jgi:hypothetical protein
VVRSMRSMLGGALQLSICTPRPAAEAQSLAGAAAGRQSNSDWLVWGARTLQSLHIVGQCLIPCAAASDLQHARGLLTHKDKMQYQWRHSHALVARAC